MLIGPQLKTLIFLSSQLAQAGYGSLMKVDGFKLNMRTVLINYIILSCHYRFFKACFIECIYLIINVLSSIYFTTQPSLLS